MSGRSRHPARSRAMHRPRMASPSPAIRVKLSRGRGRKAALPQQQPQRGGSVREFLKVSARLPVVMHDRMRYICHIVLVTHATSCPGIPQSTIRA